MSHPKRGESSPKTCADFLRERHPAKTAEHVADETGLPAATVRSWLRGQASPGFAATLILIGCYGPEFLAAVLPSARWLGAAARAEELARLRENQTALNARITALGGDDDGLEAAGARLPLWRGSVDVAALRAKGGILPAHGGGAR